MLSWVRGLLENWVARVFFGLLVVVFIFWGISNVVTLIGSNSAVAHIAGNPVDISLVQNDYQTQLERARQSASTQPDLAARQQLASAALSNVLRQRALRIEEQSLGLAAPPAAIRQMVYGMPAFQSNGVFDQTQFHQILQQNNKTPAQFLGDVNDNILNGQLLLSLIAAAAPPQELVNQIFSFVSEQRFAETVTIPFAVQPIPPSAPDAVLQRYWRNHQAIFAAPEYREVQLVLLAPALVAVHETVSDTDVQAAYARATAGQNAVPLRSVQILTVDDQKKAETLATAWKAGANWPQMQALAKPANANPIELDTAQQSQFPSAKMGDAVFTATPNVVTGPVQGPFGFYVFKVTATQSSIPPQADLMARIKQQLQLQKAQADVAQDVDNLQDALAGQTPLDKLPGNLGLVALEGTLDAKGIAPDGTPAPIPGGADLKTAVVNAAFAAHVNDPPQLINGPNGSYFALTVHSITPPSTHPYEEVKAQVAASWSKDQISREAEIKAASLLAAVNNGQTLDAAASSAGYAITMTPPVTRNAPASGVTSTMVQILFSLKLGQATMQQTDAGFIVAALAKIVQPKPQDDQTDYTEVQSAMAKAMQQDIAESFINGLQSRDNVTVNQKLFAQIYQ